MANERGAHVFGDLGISQQRKPAKQLNNDSELDRKGKMLNANAEPRKNPRKINGAAANSALESGVKRPAKEQKNSSEECHRTPNQTNASFESRRK